MPSAFSPENTARLTPGDTLQGGMVTHSSSTCWMQVWEGRPCEDMEPQGPGELGVGGVLGRLWV